MKDEFTEHIDRLIAEVNVKWRGPVIVRQRRPEGLYEISAVPAIRNAAFTSAMSKQVFDTAIGELRALYLLDVPSEQDPLSGPGAGTAAAGDAVPVSPCASETVTTLLWLLSLLTRVERTSEILDTYRDQYDAQVQRFGRRRAGVWLAWMVICAACVGLRNFARGLLPDLGVGRASKD